MERNFYERFHIKFHWVYSDLVFKVIKYLDSVPCNYKLERSYFNYYEITVKFEKADSIKPVEAMLPKEHGILIYR